MPTPRRRGARSTRTTATTRTNTATRDETTTEPDAATPDDGGAATGNEDTRQPTEASHTHTIGLGKGEFGAESADT